MKIYKTWEMVKALTENPGLKFKNKRTGDKVGLSDYGDLCWITEAKRHLILSHDPENKIPSPYGGYCVGNMLDEWELITEPVSFMEAVKAYSEGKTIWCEWLGSSKTLYENKEGNSGNEMIDNCHDSICAEEILEGCWFIKED